MTFVRKPAGLSSLHYPRHAGRMRRKRPTCSDIYAIAELHLADVRREIAQLKQIEASLAPLVEICSRQGPRDACPLFAALSHHANAPD